MLFRRSRLACRFATLLCTGAAIGLALVALPLSAQGPPELPQVYAEGMNAFQAGDYAKAATNLEAVSTKAEFTPQLEPVFYTLACAYFNLADYNKASTAFKTYQTKFPNGAHLSDVAFGLAQCAFLSKNFGDAATQFAAVAAKEARLRPQALFFEATAEKENGKIDQAIATLEKLSGGDLKNDQEVRGAMLLAQLYGQKGTSDKAVSTIRKLHTQLGLVDNIVELNSMTVELGDQLYAKRQFEGALECYRAAYPRERIIQLQTDRIARMQRAIEANLVAARSDPSQFSQIMAQSNQLKGEIAKTQKLLEDFQKLPSITPALYLRMAQCFFEIDRKWEAVVVYQELLDRFQNVPEREPALFGAILALADVNQGEKAQARCEEYLRDFKTGPNAETVGYLLGAVALQANDPQAAQTYFGRMLETQPKSNFREQMRYLLGNAYFMQGKYEEATAEYKKYLTEFPKGQSFEDVNYRLALTALFSGKYEEAMKELAAYTQKYPKGAYVSDAKYRLAVCKYAASLYDEVIKDCQSWEKEFPENQQLGEVLALLADSYAASDHEQEAIPVYIQSYKTATTDEVMNYSLFAASKLLQKRGEWNKVGDLFTEFLKEKPDHPTMITALYWIGKAKAHEGKVDEAKQIAAETIKKYINDPQREAVELLLTQLAQLSVKKKKPEPPPESPVAEPAVATTAPDATPAPTAVVVATPPPAPEPDAGAELEALLGATEKEASPTAQARAIFAKAELSRLRRQTADEERYIAQIAEKFKPEDLSPLLLGRAGDSLRSQHKLDQATAFYQRLMDEFPKSEYVDFAYNGLGEIAYEKKDLPKALRYFTDGTDKIAASQKLKDITVGKAKTLLAAGKLDEAKKIFEQVASVREWRGESTAFSVYSLGEIEAKRERWAEANAYFQRVYVAYRKFLPWVAKAYVRSGESFEKLGKKDEAANTYRELLRIANEKKEVAGFAETEEARRRLQALGG
jgi:TolA-binding protein